MIRKLLALSSVAAVLVACGASINGPATSNTGDPCKGHYACPRGCCWGANLDGEGWDCIGADEQRAGVCVYVGLSPTGDGEFAGKHNAPATPLVPTTAPPSPEPDEPPPVRHDGPG